MAIRLALTSRAKANALIRRETKQSLAKLEGVHEEDLARPVRVPPMLGVDEDMRDWSLLQVLEHNTIVNRAFARIVPALAQGKSVPQLGDPKKDVMPSEHPAPDTADQFMRSVDDYLKAADALGSLRGTIKHMHPVFGRLNAHGWHAFLGIHLAVHRAQMQAIRNKLPGREAGSISKFKRRRKVVALAVTTILAFIVIWCSLPSSPPNPQITILPHDHVIPVQPLPMPDRWIPRTWGWLWKTKYFLFGKPSMATIHSQFFLYDKKNETRWAAGLGTPFSTTNGVQAWFLSGEQATDLSNNLKEWHGNNIPESRATLGEGSKAIMVMRQTTKVSGVSLDAHVNQTSAINFQDHSLCYMGDIRFWFGKKNPDPRLSGRSEPYINLHTNLLLNIKTILPQGQSLFLFDTNLAHPDYGDGAGVLIQWN